MKDDEFCIKNDEFCMKYDDFCIKNDEFCMKMMIFVSKMINFVRSGSGTSRVIKNDDFRSKFYQTMMNSAFKNDDFRSTNGGFVAVVWPRSRRNAWRLAAPRR